MLFLLFIYYLGRGQRAVSEVSSLPFLLQSSYPRCQEVNIRIMTTTNMSTSIIHLGNGEMAGGWNHGSGSQTWASICLTLVEHHHDTWDLTVSISTQTLPNSPKFVWVFPVPSVPTGEGLECWLLYILVLALQSHPGDLTSPLVTGFLLWKLDQDWKLGKGSWLFFFLIKVIAILDFFWLHRPSSLSAGSPSILLPGNALFH